MLSNYLQTALRNLLTGRLPSLINVFGLALGIACVLMIFLYLQVELSYDRFHEKAEDLYRITWEDNNPQTRTPHPLAQALKADFPEVENAVSLTPLYAAGLTRETHAFRSLSSDIWYDEKNILAVDTTFFDVFSFPLIKGNARTALKHVNGLLISESMAKKYFPGEDAMGQHLAVDAGDHLLEVVGVFKDVPFNTHFHFDFLVSYLREKSYDSLDAFYSWEDFGHYNYVRLQSGVDPKALERKLMPWLRKHIDVPDAAYQAMLDQGHGLRLQPITAIHLHSRLRWELEANGNIGYVYILSAAALLTLVIACVNFINLSTARAAERAREIGVRKTLGATQGQLSFQFLTESVLTACISIVLAILIVEVVLPFFNAATGLAVNLDYGVHGLMVLGLGLLVGIVAGSYPSAYLSAIKPHLVLKGQGFSGRGVGGMRGALIVFQFFISMVLASSALILYQQLDFLTNADPGFEKQALIVIPVKNEDGVQRFDALQTQLMQVDGVLSVSASSNLPGGSFNQHHISSPVTPDTDIPTSEMFIDYDFFNTMDITLAEGRAFLRENPADSNAYILNETAAKQLNLQGTCVGQEISWKRRESGSERRGRVIGVVKDFHFQSMHQPIQPLLIALTRNQFNHIVIKVETTRLEEKLAAIAKVYKTLEPVFTFEYAFLEDRLNAQYLSERRTGLILGIFTAIAILIACFGLFAMTLLTFQQKVKALSVRKVLGASVREMLFVVLGGFTRLILLAVFLATPIAWWMMDGWLQNFSNRISIHPFNFIGSGLLLIAAAWLTLAYFTWKALKLNPAETLKSE